MWKMDILPSVQQIVNSYEEARQQRIARNQQMLDSLGLSHSTAAKQPAIKSRKLEVSAPQQPLRRSKRRQGLTTPVGPERDAVLVASESRVMLRTLG